MSLPAGSKIGGAGAVTSRKGHAETPYSGQFTKMLSGLDLFKSQNLFSLESASLLAKFSYKKAYLSHGSHYMIAILLVGN